MYADAFLREGILIGIEQEVELPPCGHGDHERLFQKLLNCAVASDIGHKLLHICPEVLHICHPGRHGHFVEAEQNKRHPTDT